MECSKRREEESLSYYNEYTQILSLYNELKTKSSRFPGQKIRHVYGEVTDISNHRPGLQTDYESLQSAIQQKNEAWLECNSRLINHQNLLHHEKKKSEVDSLRSTLIERDTKIQQLVDNKRKFVIKQSE